MDILSCVLVCLAFLLSGLPAGAQESRPASRRSGNRLASEKSPYLLQHAGNPVDWWPWCEEAFAEARRRNVPVFLSIGYSTCHWCHVMEHESFEDEATARFMNENFVCIKLDREERPDIDACYMNYVMMATGGHGGWPASIWMTAEKAPFYAGTYFPKHPGFGRPSFMQVLEGLARAWKDNRKNLEATAAQAVRALKEAAATGAAKELPSPDLLARAAGEFLAGFDDRHGGFHRGGPKFPSTTTHDLLFLHAWRNGDAEAAEAAAFSLKAMARGGIHDHVGGGFHRYATDARWIVPHFEKMLYDQARIAATMLDAGLQTGDPEFFAITRDILDCVLRDFRSPEGAFTAAFDADSDDREGAFYVWKEAEVKELLTEEEWKIVRLRFDISKDGNFPDEPGENILAVRNSWTAVAEEADLSADKARTLWESARGKLRAAREKRPHPGLDDKIIAGWNGLMITALARAGRVLDEPRYLRAAEEAATFVLARLRKKDGSLLRRWCRGTADHPAVLKDYAYLGQGLLDLFEAGGEVRWLRDSLNLVDRALTLCKDPAGAFFDAPASSTDVLVRTKEFYDGATPAGNGYFSLLLVRLAALTGREPFREAAIDILKTFKERITQRPTASCTMAQTAVLLHDGLREIVLVGPFTDQRTRDLRSAVNRAWVPDAVRCIVDTAAAERETEWLPLLEGRTGQGVPPRVYICRNGVCNLPLDDPREVRTSLEKHP